MFQYKEQSNKESLIEKTMYGGSKDSKSFPSFGVPSDAKKIEENLFGKQNMRSVNQGESAAHEHSNKYNQGG